MAFQALLLRVISTPSGEFRFCVEENVQDGGAVVRRHADETRVRVPAYEDLREPPPKVILHLTWQGVEGFRIDQITAGIFENAGVEVEIVK